MADPAQPSRLSPKRLLPLLLLAAGLGLFFALGWHRYLTLDSLRQHHRALADWVNGHPAIAAPAYILVYIVAVAFSLPGGAILSITGGLLFGTIMATLWVEIGATAGATLLFLLARTALGEPLRARAGPWMQKLEAGFRKDAISYLFVLRLIPIPFFVVNLVPAFLGVKLSVFVITTLIGIFPGVLVYTSIGSGLREVLEAGGAPDLRFFTKPEIVLPLVGLIVLALIPVAYKRWKGRPA